MRAGGWAAVIAVALVVSGLVLFALDEQRQARFLESEATRLKASTVAAAPEPVQARRVIEVPKPASLPTQPAPAQGSDKKRAALQAYDAYQNAADYRVLVESLLANPTDTSGYYVVSMLKTCRAVRRQDTMNRLPPTISSEQDDARQRWFARCSSFTDEELSLQHLGEIMMDPRVRGRFHELAAQSELGTAKIGSERRNRYRDALLAAEDPILLEKGGADLFVDLAGDAPVFEGKAYPQEATPVILMAWHSAVCEAMGVVCGKGDEFVQGACAWSGVCVNSRQELMRYAVQHYRSAEDLKLYDHFMGRLVSLIRNKGRPDRRQ